MSEFWRRKIKTYFRRLDKDQDGWLTREDYEKVSERHGRVEEIDSSERTTIKEKLLRLFDAFEREGGSDGRVSEEGLIKACLKLRDDLEFVKILEELVRTTFLLLDVDADGYFDEKDYIKFLYTRGIPDHENLAKVAFKELDTDHDGRLSLQQLTDAIVMYFVSDDEYPCLGYFFGPLI